MAKVTVQSVNKCPTCRTNKAGHSPQYGVIACQACRDSEQKISSRTYEVIPDHIKEEREEYKWQTIQPFRNGRVSREYIERYGTKHIEVTPEEVEKAQNVWSRDLPGEYYKE